MSNSNHEKPKKYFKKRKLIRILSRNLTTIGWLTLMYYMWLQPEMIGIILSLILIFLGDTLEELVS